VVVVKPELLGVHRLVVEALQQLEVFTAIARGHIVHGHQVHGRVVMKIEDVGKPVDGSALGRAAASNVTAHADSGHSQSASIHRMMLLPVTVIIIMLAWVRSRRGDAGEESSHDDDGVVVGWLADLLRAISIFVVVAFIGTVTATIVFLPEWPPRLHRSDEERATCAPDGVVNWRDLGGLTTADGGWTVRRKQVSISTVDCANAGTHKARVGNCSDFCNLSYLLLHVVISERTAHHRSLQTAHVLLNNFCYVWLGIHRCIDLAISPRCDQIALRWSQSLTCVARVKLDMRPMFVQASWGLPCAVTILLHSRVLS